MPADYNSGLKVIEGIHVNLIDLVDIPDAVLGQPTTVTLFESELALSQYTKATGKFFPRENVHSGGFLRYLLRHINNPGTGGDMGISRRGGKPRRRRRGARGGQVIV